jgi:hypothetical protein
MYLIIGTTWFVVLGAVGSPLLNGLSGVGGSQPHALSLRAESRLPSSNAEVPDLTTTDRLGILEENPQLSFARDYLVRVVFSVMPG